MMDVRLAGPEPLRLGGGRGDGRQRCLVDREHHRRRGISAGWASDRLGLGTA